LPPVERQEAAKRIVQHVAPTNCTVLAGPNGAGKSTLWRALCSTSPELHGLRFINADHIAGQLKSEEPLSTELDEERISIEAAKVAENARTALVSKRMPFAFETVFSDAHGAKLQELREMQEAGYAITMFYVAIESPVLSDARVTQRVGEGGHDVPREKLVRRHKQSLANLKKAVSFLDEVRVYDNSDAKNPYQLACTYMKGKRTFLNPAMPKYLKRLFGVRLDQAPHTLHKKSIA
jgi:predicted ABC-type ATPase